MRDMNKQKYYLHKSNAKKRGLKMLMTFEEWFDIWQKSGKWEQRGHSAGQYCMSRFNDLGDYAVGNVFIQLHSSNMSQAKKDKVSARKGKVGNTVSDATRIKLSIAATGRKRTPESIQRGLETKRGKA
jgi:hypothetical protein